MFDVLYNNVTLFYRKTMKSNGPLDGTTSWSPCLTPTSSGLGMKIFFTLCTLYLKLPWSWCLLAEVMVFFLCLSSIMNSLVIVLFLSGMVAMIMLRTLHKDIARYNQVDQVRKKIIISVSKIWLFRLFSSSCVLQGRFKVHCVATMQMNYSK